MRLRKYIFFTSIFQCIPTNEQCMSALRRSCFSLKKMMLKNTMDMKHLMLTCGRKNLVHRHRFLFDTNLPKLTAPEKKMTLSPHDYDFGDPKNYHFATTVTCGSIEGRKMFVRAFGHMLNYNHEQAIACFSKCTEIDPSCAMAWWGIAYCVSSNYNWSPGLGSGHYSPPTKTIQNHSLISFRI